MTTTLPAPSDDRPHHINGPSRLYLREKCHGSRRMELLYPHEAPSPDAERGRLMHAAVWDDAILATLPAPDQRMIETVRYVLADLRQPATNPGEWQIEQKLSIYRDDSDEPILYGYADGYFIAGKMAFLVYFKFGFVEVDNPAENTQFAALATALLQENVDIDGVMCVAIQPAVSSKVKAYTFTNFHALYDSILKIVDATYAPELVLNAGQHCQYCRAKAGCPAFNEVSNAVVATLPGEITAEAAPRLYRKAKLVEKLCAEIKARCRQHVEQAAGQSLGAEGEGLRLVQTPGNRIVADPQALYDALAEVMTVPEFLALVKVPIGTLDTFLTKRLTDRGLVAKKKDVRGWIDEHLPITREPDKTEIETF